METALALDPGHSEGKAEGPEEEIVVETGWVWGLTVHSSVVPRPPSKVTRGHSLRREGIKSFLNLLSPVVSYLHTYINTQTHTHTLCYEFLHKLGEV